MNINLFMGANKIDVNIGDNFGRWTVLEEDFNRNGRKGRGKMYICACECGTKRSVKKSSLLSGKSKSCGCSYNPPKILDGERFGKLVVVESIANYEGSGKSAYRCLCDCGNETIVKSTSIYKTKSCGCSRLDRTRSNVGKKFGSLTITDVYYSENGTFADCICDCGQTTTARLDQIKSGNTTSCGCAKTPNLIGKRFGKLTVIDKFETENRKKNWLCKCDCGCETVLSTHILISGHTQSCGCLRSEKTSIGETYIAEFLSHYHIKFEKEKTFDQCKNVKSLRYDFYLPEYNTCIEYDGEQHRKPVAYFGGEEGYKIRLENDRIKTEYCEKHNIRLVRITAKTKEEIESIIINIIQDPVTTIAV